MQKKEIINNIKNVAAALEELYDKDNKQEIKDVEDILSELIETFYLSKEDSGKIFIDLDKIFR